MIEEIRASVSQARHGMTAAQWKKMHTETRKATIIGVLLWFGFLVFYLCGGTDKNRLSFLALPILFFWLLVIIAILVAYRSMSRELARRVSKNIDSSEKTKGH